MKTSYTFNSDNRTSTAYLGTVDHHSVIGEHIVKRLRDEVKFNNKIGYKKKYIKLHGRMGKNNPNAHKYHGLKYRGSGAHSHQTIKLEDAAYADIYIYNRY